ncbi:MAG: radical SAM protein [Dehalococcoidia bacterium]|nr:MAG: radical SAM protein [Dehalococcoidia bacterium]
MKVLFIYPNTSGTGEIPISLGYLQSRLKGEGHEVKIFDLSMYRAFCQSEERSTEMGQFKPVTPREDMPVPNIKDVDPKEDLLQIVKDYNPGLVAVTSFTTNFKVGISLLEEIKRHFKDICTIYGGIHTILLPGEVINEPSVDMVCVGEGEELIAELCNKLESNSDITSIRNLWAKSNGKVIKNELRPLIDLDNLPFWDFDGFDDYNFYRPLAGKLYRMANVDISRGCPFRCSYCVNHTLQKMFKGLGKYHRVKSVNKAIDDLVHVKEKYNVEMMRFWDEDFGVFTLDYLKELAEEYKKRVNLPFLIYAGVSSLDEEKVKVLRNMGCVTIGMGIESGNENIRRDILNRRMSNEKIVTAFNLVKDYGIRVSSYNMIGLPFETRENIFDTIELNRRCKPATSSVVFLEPYPKTEIHTIGVDNGFIEPGYIPVYGFLTPHIKEKLISHQELNGLLKTFTIYTRVPRLLYPLVKICEKDNLISNWIFKVLVKLYGGH